MFTPKFNRKVKHYNTKEFAKERYDFLKQLIHEYTTTASHECRKQTLANLANFAYDPINYEFMKQLHLVDLFISELSNDNCDLVHFALSGICNISCDPESREYIICMNGVNRISELLLHKHEDIALNALTTLYYLFESKNVTIPQDIKRKVQQYAMSCNPRYKNLGSIFLDTYRLLEQ
ncbi:unnamed protein product [Acanthoscelides obtectus]|uniref:Armadillo repeat-containing protein 7 n=1 Tax=Acanthoscelides obtectus TaxID=200917 RepID=A0A9P0L0S3_ACAOB|nr:unnamed protein product [Acanthoscelides obtectus]CAK1677582.1 Armadillo repeat-containing protein 7 [Acanthoscelides obtectus]